MDVAEQFGTRTLWVYKLQMGAPHALTREERLRKPLSYEDAMAIKEQMPLPPSGLRGAVSRNGRLRPAARHGAVQGPGHGTTPCSWASTADHLQLLNATLGEGRFFTDADDLHRRDVAVIGNGVRERFFPHEDPDRQDASWWTATAWKSSARSLSSNRSWATTRTTRPSSFRIDTFQKTYPEAKDNFICVLVEPGKMDQAKDEVTELLRRRRHVKPADPDNFGISSAESVIGQFRQIIGTVALVMVVISSIGLLVGGIGVMNIMLVSVTERTREIGVRKAMGARRSDITWQFLLEAMTLTASGGLIGIAGGLAAQRGHPHVRSQPAFHRAACGRWWRGSPWPPASGFSSASGRR